MTSEVRFGSIAPQMKTHPYPEVTIDAPLWMRKAYKAATGKTMEQRYREKVEELMVNILQKLFTQQ